MTATWMHAFSWHPMYEVFAFAELGQQQERQHTQNVYPEMVTLQQYGKKLTEHLPLERVLKTGTQGLC
jgi:hypothetical protein